MLHTRIGPWCACERVECLYILYQIAKSHSTAHPAAWYMVTSNENTAHTNTTTRIESYDANVIWKKVVVVVAGIVVVAQPTYGECRLVFCAAQNSVFVCFRTCEHATICNHECQTWIWGVRERERGRDGEKRARWTLQMKKKRK